MNNTTLINALYDVIKHMEQDQRNTAEMLLEGRAPLSPVEYAGTTLTYSKSSIFSGDPAYIVADIIRALKAETAQKEVKASNNYINTAAQKRVVGKMLNGHLVKTNEKLSGYWLHKGKQAVCDGFRIFLFANENTTLPKLPAKIEPMTEKSIDDMFNDPRNNDLELEKPNTALLKAYIKRNKTKYTYPPYHFGNIIVSSQYLCDLLEVMPSCKLYMSSDEQRGFIKPIYAVDDEGNEALLLPVRPDKKEEYKTVDSWKTTPDMYNLGDEYKTIL